MNFTLNELIRTNTGIKNYPSIEQLKNLIRITENILQPTRDLYGKAILVNSGFRNKKVNDAVGGKKNSQHLKGEAVDITTQNINDLEEIVQIIKMFDFDQMIVYDTFIHVSLKLNNNRNQLIYLNEKKR